MAGFEIKVRNLETQETLIATLDRYEDAVTWLQDRPAMIEVLGVLSDVSPVQMQQLKEAMRPYDDDERAMIASRAGELVEALRRQREADERRNALDEAAAREEAKRADPNRPLKIKWTLEEGCTVNDAFDPREITAAARDAVLAWVKERNGWVADRGQIVVEAEVEVYPNAIPSGDEGDRVIRGGKFVPRMRDTEA